MLSVSGAAKPRCPVNAKCHDSVVFRTDSVGPFLHYLMAECGVSPNTLAAYRSDLMRFVRWHKSEAPGPLASLDTPALSGYVECLSLSGLAPSSVCRHLASLSTFFRFMVFEGRLPENLVKLLIAPSIWDGLPTVLFSEAVRALLESPTEETRIGRRDRAALETLYATGCRVSEVAGLAHRSISISPREPRDASARGTKSAVFRWAHMQSRLSLATSTKTGRH